MYLFAFIALLVAIAIAFAVRAHREGRFNFRPVLKRATTWLGLLTLAQGGAVLAFSQAPQEWKNSLPESLPGYLLVGMMVLGAITPVANSIAQRAGVSAAKDPQE